MGASESKLVFKQGIFKLQEARTIPADDPYWTGFWQLPESTEDVFTLFSTNDIRRTRDRSISNLETLILAITSRLFHLRKHPSFPHPDLAPEKEVLNCLRVLTRILPFIFEAPELEGWENKFLWGTRRVRANRGLSNGSEVLFDEANPEADARDGDEQPAEFKEAKPLAEELLDTLVDLLFYEGFTIPLSDQPKSKVNYSIWTSGVGCNAAAPSNSRLESNRTEVMRLLLTLASKSMYVPANVLPIQGVKSITYLVTCPDKQVVLSMLCSFLNTAVKFNPASWRIPYDHVVVGDPKHLYVASSLQLLLVLLLYPVPEDGKGAPQKNYFRHFLGRLHRTQDFEFICEGMSRTLHQPLGATSSYLPGSQKPVRWAPEMIMLFWETIQSNKRFRSFIVDADRGHDFIVLMLFYAIDNRMDPSKQGVVRMCIFVLQTLSVEDNFGSRLNKTFQKPESLPPAIKIDNWSGSYGDFLIVSIHNLITGSKGKLDAIYSALLAIINNIAAYLENINALSCLKLLQLFASMSLPSFLLANETNHSLLTSLLEAVNAIVEHKYKENPKFITYIFKSRKRFEALRSFTLESGQEEIQRLQERRKQGAEDADGLHSPAPSSRADSIDALRSPAGGRTPSLSNVPEESSAFAVGDDEDSEGEDQPLTATPSASSTTFRSSRTPSIDSSVDGTVPVQLRGMSEKARGKMPAGAPPFSRVNSSHSLSTTATLSSPTAFVPSPEWIDTWLPSLPLHTILTLLAASPTTDPPSSLPPTIEPAPPRIHSFEWSPLSLGWYESLLWSLVCRAEMQVGGGGGVVARGGGSGGAVGVWNGTNIRLFKVEKEAARGPSLMNPGGAVDAVGSSIVQRIGSLNLRGAGTGAGATAAAAAAGAPGEGARSREASGRGPGSA